MTSPQQQMDPALERLVSGAAEAVSSAIPALGVQLSYAREMVGQQQTRIGDLEQEKATMAAELARAHQVADGLRQQLAELQAQRVDSEEGGELENTGNAGDDKDAGNPPEEGPGDR